MVIGATIDRAIAPSDETAMVGWMVALVVCFAFLSFSWRFGSRQMDAAELGTDHDLRLDVVRRLVDRRGVRGGAGHRGRLLSIATSDTLLTGSSAVMWAVLAGAVAALGVAGVVLFTTSVELGVIVIVGSAVLLLATTMVSSRLERRTADEQARAAAATAAATDIVTGLRVIHGLDARDAASDRYAGVSATLLDSSIRTARTSASIDAATTLLNGVFLAVVALVGGHLADEGSITIGQLVAAFGLAQFMVGPWSRLSFAWSFLARVRAARRRVAEVVTAPYAVDDVEGADQLLAGAQLHGDGDGAPLLAVRDLAVGNLHHVSITGRRGELIAVLPPSIADGDALARTLVHLADPTAGDVLLDGVPVGSLSYDAVHSRAVMSPRQTAVFAGRLIDNIATTSCDARTVESAVDAATAREILDGAEDGTVTEHGRSLSGGQRQRIALARALATDRDVLVLVDPTSHVDAATELAIVQHVREMRRRQLTLVITSSATWLGAADRVVAITEPSRVVTGRHVDLVSGDLAYAARVVS